MGEDLESDGGGGAVVVGCSFLGEVWGHAPPPDLF